jgi:hypothetical protein
VASRGEILDKQRHKRIRQLLSRLNKERRQQDKKIDILCNDMVSAQKDFVNQIQSLMFSVNFYETLIGQKDQSILLDTAAAFIRENISGVNVAIFLLESNGFALHIVDEDKPVEIDTAGFESWFTAELVAGISRANHICRLDDMFQMGLHASPSQLSRISVAAIPLSRFCQPVGFILLYRDCENDFTSQELERIAGITGGLCSAITSCQQVAVQNTG